MCAVQETSTARKTFYKVSNADGKEFAALELDLEDVLYFEYVKAKRRIRIALAKEVYEYSYVMEKLVRELEEYGFAIGCRGNLINLSHVNKIKGQDIFMDNGKTLPLSQKRIREFRDKVNGFVHHPC